MARVGDKRKQANYVDVKISVSLLSIYIACHGLFASKPAPTFEMRSPVGAGLLAKISASKHPLALKYKKPRHKDRAFQFQPKLRTLRLGYAGSHHRCR
jgi:hypothetical protein